LLRQYFPKRSEISHFTQADLDAVAAELNGRPRQTLGWRSPSQALDEALRLPPETAADLDQSSGKGPTRPTIPLDWIVVSKLNRVGPIDRRVVFGDRSPAEADPVVVSVTTGRHANPDIAELRAKVTDQLCDCLAPVEASRRIDKLSIVRPRRLKRLRR
jgi:hypothetical protein